MIPKKFHRIWFGDRPRPERYDEYWAAWQDMHPDWEFHTWTESNLGPLVNIVPWTVVGEIAKSCGVSMSHDRAVAVMRADIAAYEIVHNLGGFYLNCDMMPLKPFTPLTGSHAILGMEDDWHVCNAVMGGEPKHPLFRDVIRMLPVSLQQYGSIGMEVATGPQLLTRVWRSGTYDVDVLPTSAFYPAHHSEVPYGSDNFDHVVQKGRDQDSYACHMWGHRSQEGDLFN